MYGENNLPSNNISQFPWYVPTWVPYPVYPSPAPCPGCGRCPVCGRKDGQTQSGNYSGTPQSN